MKTAVNPPRSPVTKGSNTVAMATVPNVCKMPGPPAPFVPVPLPNIGKSSSSPKGYTKKVKVEGQPAAIAGATFKSMGDAASKGTGGGLLSSTTHDVTKFIAPGSMDTKFEGKAVQLLGDVMSNNNGGAPNSATLMGALHSPVLPGDARPGDTPDACDHDWEEIDSKTPEEQKQANEDLAGRLTKAKQAGSKRGYEFENTAIDANMEEMDIQKCGVEYKCKKCGQAQEVDIVGKDQIAEAKSRSAKKVKSKGGQARRIRDIQQKKFNIEKNPRAKLDGTLTDATESGEKYLERGFEVETVGAVA